MKQLFAIFCAVILLPTFNSYAWIGGPFSNNTFFGENGDDGVYEAVGTTTNGVGLFRWGVANNFQGIDPSQLNNFTQIFFDDEGNIIAQIVQIDPFSSNVFFGGVGQLSHSWFLEGVSYSGTCFGTVNSGLGFISCVGTAAEATGTTTERISSSFTASFDSQNDGTPVRRFAGTGLATSSNNPNTQISFIVFGTKVAESVNYGT